MKRTDSASQLRDIELSMALEFSSE